MKILYVDLQYEYGMKDRGINQIGHRGFYQVFQKLGHEVDCFYIDDYLKNTSQLQVDLIKKVKNLKPDLVYFVLFGKQIKIETLKTLNSISKTINWFGDDQWRFDSFTKEYALHFTYSVTTDPFALSKYSDLGVRNVFLSQWAAIDHDFLQNYRTDYEYGVSFIGGSHSVRRWFIQELEKKGIRVATFGFGWPAGVVALEKMVDIFQKSKINLNLSNSITYDIRYLSDNIKNPIVALKTPKTSSQIKARNFEIPYYGGFQLTDYVPFLEDYFIIGKEIVCYRDIDEAVQQIKFYLKNDELREKIKQASIRRAQAEHSYFHRHKKIFEEMK